MFLWLAQILPATLAGTPPPSIIEANLPVNVIYSLDLGVLTPAFVSSAHWLRKRRAWGYAFTGVLLVKIATLGLAVLAMIVFMIRDGQTVVLPQVVIFVILSLLALVLTIQFVLSIDPETDPIPTAPSPGRSSET